MREDELLRKEGVGDIMMVLLDNPGIPQNKLAEISELSNFKITQLVPMLSLAGFITGKRGKTKIITLTEKGEEKAKLFKKLLSR